MSTLAVNSLTSQTGTTITLASGRTLDVSNGTVIGAAGDLGKTLQNKYSSKVQNIAMTATSFTEISTNMRVSLTIQSTTTFLDFTCPLYTEVDSVSTHGMARLQYSTDSGSNWSNIGTYNVTQAVDNGVGFGFTDYWDHNLAANTSVIFRVQYRKGNAAGNHAIADTGPGENPSAYLKVSEIIAST